MQATEIGRRLSEVVDCRTLSDDVSRRLYSVDASSYFLKPAVITFPRDEYDVIKIVKFAAKNRIPITPRGAGTGLVGSALGEGIILDMRHLNKIKVGHGYVEVGSGVFKGHLDAELEKHGRFLGPDPSIGPYCTIGGMIATNASGIHSLKYGSIIDNLIQVRMITAFGKLVTMPAQELISKEILELIKPEIRKKFPHVSKNSCGYRIDKINSKDDLQKLIAGSEGTLGVVISAKLKTFPIPKNNILIIITYKTLMQAAVDVPKIVQIKPSAVEIIDNNVAKHIKIGKSDSSRCMVFVEFDHNISANMARIRSITTTGRIVKTITQKKVIKKWWSFRNSALSYSLRSISEKETMPTLIEDATVPVEKLPLLLELINKIVSKYNLRAVIYGHAGNANLHIRPILKRKDKRLIKKIALEFFSGVISIGGCITGEHGDGLARSEFVRLQYGNEVYSIFKRIKHIFDPANILNPGKIISKKSTITKNLKI